MEVACPQITLRKFVLLEERKLASNHAVKVSKGTWHHRKIWERKGPSGGIVQKCEPQERNPCAPKFEDRTLQETLQQERCARRDAWDLEKGKKPRSPPLPKHGIMPAPSSKKPEDGDFVAELGASMHMLS